jgi:arylsulfatase A-like enzyme/Flp pilus assembly protein TadD
VSGKIKVILALVLIVIVVATVFKLTTKGPQGNLILITLDTTRADRLGCYGYENIHTPNMDYLAQHGVLFENAISPAPLTLPAHTSLLTGLYPPVHGIRNNTTYKLSEKAVTLTEILSDHGYRTGAVIGAFVLDSGYGLDQGFASYDDELDRPAQRPTTLFTMPGHEDIQIRMEEIAERRAPAVTKKAIAWLKQNSEERFFLWVHYYDPHYPYSPPEDVLSNYEERPYDGEIAYIDRHLGQILDELKSSELIDNTLIVLAGDHGEGLGDHRESKHSILIYDPMVRVPLIMSYPARLEEGKRVGATVSLVDVAPTILDILEIDHDMKIDGVSLTAAMKGDELRERAVYSESMSPYLTYGWSELASVRNSDWKYIQSSSPELYNVTNDPAELTNLIDEEKDVAAKLEAALDSLVAGAPAADSGLAEKSHLSPTERERLVALGYVAGAPPVREKASLKSPREMIVFHELIDSGEDAMKKMQYEEALAKFQQVTSVDPTNALAHNLIGMVYYKIGDTTNARVHFLEAIEFNPSLADPHHNLGNIYFHEENYREAASCYEKAVELDPEAGEYYVALGQIYARLGEMEKAQSAYEKALAFGYSSPRLFLANGISLMRIGRFEEARKSFEDAIKVSPNSAEAYNEYGNLLDKTGDLQGAVEKYQRALSINSDYTQAHYNLARMLLKSGKNGEAMRELVLTVQQDPAHAEAHYLLGELYFRQGEKAKAKDHLSRFVALGTTNQAAKQQAEARLAELR